jgi:hypothetical protein
MGQILHGSAPLVFLIQIYAMISPMQIIAFSRPLPRSMLWIAICIDQSETVPAPL